MASVRKRTWTTATGERREKWVVAYRDHARKQHIETFPTKGEAVDRRRAIENELQVGTHTPISSKTTLADACTAWIERGKAERLESSTIRQRQLHVDLHILPLLGAETRLAKLTRPMVEHFRDQLLQTRSPAMARKVLTSVKSCLKDAQSRGLVAQNAARDVGIRTNGRHKPRLEVGVDIPEPAEVKALIGTTAGKAHALAFLAGFAGLRASELRGLAWSRLELGDNPAVTIVERADENNALGSPKWDASKRTIRLNQTTAKALRAWKVAQPPLVTQDGDGNEIKRPRALVFGTAADRPDGLANIRRRLLGPAWVDAGVALPVLDAAGKPVVDRKGTPVMRPKYTGLHALRHFAISSWLKTCNGDFKAVQTRAGHATLALTLDTYGHLLSTNDRDQIDAAEKLVVT